jgi:DNA-binding protein H-NS
VLAALEENDLTLEDLKATNGAAKPKKAATKKAVKKPVAKKKKPLPPKYQDPETGATWSGHARPPSWIANVKNRDDYLIAQE